MNGEAILHLLEIAGLPIAPRKVGAGVILAAIGQMEAAGGLKLMRRVAAPSTRRS